MLCSPFVYLCFWIMSERLASLSSPPIVYSVRFWNRKAVSVIVEKAFGYAPLFVNDFSRALSLAQLNHAPFIGWSSRVSADQEARIRQHVPFYRLEDGFIRSVGLGAGLTGGASYVMDRKGIYYNAKQESALESMLNDREITSAQAERAQKLIDKIVSLNLTKYNIQGKKANLPKSDHQEKILVIGQVADDASIRNSLSNTLDCANSENINLDLISAARARYPEACIVFKPHPDVVKGLRKGAVTHQEIASMVDAVSAEVDILEAIHWCDRLVTVSSLSGFEALLRGKQVTTFGSPFYAGWGLTEDDVTFERRTKTLTLQALVYQLLVEYSHYYDPRHERACEPEVLVKYLSRQKRSWWVGVKCRVLTTLSWVGTRLGI